VRKLVDGADEVIRGLRALQCDNQDPWLIFILLSKLDRETRQSWAQCAESETPSVAIDQFLTFLTSHGDTFGAYQLALKLDDLLLPIMLTPTRDATKTSVYIASRLINCTGVTHF